jgi:hypothetical protein
MPMGEGQACDCGMPNGKKVSEPAASSCRDRHCPSVGVGASKPVLSSLQIEASTKTFEHQRGHRQLDRRREHSMTTSADEERRGISQTFEHCNNVKTFYACLSHSFGLENF